MQRRYLISLLFVISLHTPYLAAKDVWTVESPGKLDARLVRQLEDLARRHKAIVRYLHGTPESTRAPGRKTLTVELPPPLNLDDFFADAKRYLGDGAKELTRETASDAYTFGVTSESFTQPYRIHIAAASLRGFHNALLRLPQLLNSRKPEGFSDLSPPLRFSNIQGAGRTSVVSLADFPSFPERGIVEGFYGKPWSHDDRLAMLRFEGAHAMNVYYYAPKDDPYHRARWRDPYPPAQLKRLGELADTARENFVDFCFAISPGLSMVYSRDADFSDLTRKLEAVGKLGVNCFALFLDDVPQELQDPQDKARFKTLAEAHVYVINRLHDYLKSESTENRLVVTPTVYTNEWGSLDYVRDLGAGVNADVPIVWTGTEVVSPTITVAQAEDWGALLRRKPLVWDNFPVNDGIPWRINLGPLRGRDPNLPSAIRGLFSNPMNQPRASMIPLQTIAEYLWNSAAYDPDAARRRALEDHYGKDAGKRLATFLATYSDYWWDNNIFKPLFVEERTPIDVAAIRRRIASLQSALRGLRGKARYQPLMRELSPLPSKPAERLPEVLADPAFRHQSDGTLVWREDYQVLYAPHLGTPPALDGDFGKWRSGPLYVLDEASQIFAGAKLWRGPSEFSARFALGWDANYLYVGAEVTDPALFQPFTGRDIANGDVVALMLETAFRKHFTSVSATGDEYELLFSPGDFAGVKPDVYSEEDYLPHRKVVHDYAHGIKTAWKKTASGFSGDVAIPAEWFDGGHFQPGGEVGLVLGAQKASPVSAPAASDAEEAPHILLRSKADHVFPAHVGNPSSYQRVVLIDSNAQ